MVKAKGRREIASKGDEFGGWNGNQQNHNKLGRKEEQPQMQSGWFTARNQEGGGPRNAQHCSDSRLGVDQMPK